MSIVISPSTWGASRQNDSAIHHLVATIDQNRAESPDSSKTPQSFFRPLWYPRQQTRIEPQAQAATIDMLRCIRHTSGFKQQQGKYTYLQAGHLLQGFASLNGLTRFDSQTLKATPPQKKSGKRSHCNSPDQILKTANDVTITIEWRRATISRLPAWSALLSAAATAAESTVRSEFQIETDRK